ncbi:MAG TPA: hypothetical protein VMU62_07965 [Acidobacteriaceae bacterium]|nr:hypothetical protein [Acidobacteriaceae bacterium]
MQVEHSPTLTAETFPKTTTVQDARLNIDPTPYPGLYNKIPFGFTHNLHTLDIFQFDSMRELADRFSSASSDVYFVAGNAPTPGSAFFSVSHDELKPNQAIELLEKQPLRILLKRPEEQDTRFLKLLDLLFQQILELRGGIDGQRVRRLESAILISSAATITPIHFDPEVGFFSQIEGEKTYHAYAPKDVSEPDLERFYIRGAISIGRLDMEHRNPENEHVFDLRPGKGFHQPQNAPHWVETRGTRSISYTCVFETDATRAQGRTRAFNHYQRKCGLTPAAPGMHPQFDRLKAEAMLPDLFARKVARRVKNTFRSE